MLWSSKISLVIELPAANEAVRNANPSPYSHLVRLYICACSFADSIVIDYYLLNKNLFFRLIPRVPTKTVISIYAKTNIENQYTYAILLYKLIRLHVCDFFYAVVVVVVVVQFDSLL